MNAFIVIYCLQSFLNLPFHLKYLYFCHITKYYDIWVLFFFFLDFPRGSDGKVSAYNVGDPGSIPGLGRSSGEGWQPIPVFLPGKSHGRRSIVGYSPWSRKESDTTE